MMQCRRSSSGWRHGWSVVAGVVLAAFAGCGAPETPSTFVAGSGGGNPLNGGVISDDGQDFRFSLAEDGSVGEVSIGNAAGATGKKIVFDGIDGGAAVPRQVDFGTGGENTASFDRDNGNFNVSVNAPFGLGRVDLGGPLEDLGDIGFLPARTASQQAPVDCDTAVASVDDFCFLYDGSRDAAVESVTQLALRVAGENGFPDAADPFIEQVVRDFFDVLDDFCNAWTELREGTADDPAVNPCDFAG